MTDRPFVNFDFPVTGSTFKRTLPARLNDTVNVKDWGALGDGSTNDTAEIQAAIDFCTSQGGGKVFFPAGYYIISAEINVGSSDADASVQLIGSGGSGNAINTLVSGSMSGFVFSKGSGTYDNLSHIEGLGIFNTSTAAGSGAVKLTLSNSSISGCTLQGMIMLDASQVDGCTITDCNGNCNEAFQPAGSVWPLQASTAVGYYLGDRCTAIDTRCFAGAWLAFAVGGTGTSLRGCSTETTAISVRFGWSPLMTQLTTGTALNGTNTLTFASFPPGSSPGRGVTGTSIPASTTISRIDGNTIYLSANITAQINAGATITFSQENPAIACTIQNFQNEGCDTSIELYNCVACICEGCAPNPTSGRSVPQIIHTMAWSGGTVTATTTAVHNIPATSLSPGNTHRLEIGTTTAYATNWYATTADLWAVATRTGTNTFTFPGPGSDPGPYTNDSMGWNDPLHYGMRFRKVYDTMVISCSMGANTAHSSYDFIYATVANPTGEADHINNVMISTIGPNGWALPVAANRASWKFIDCGTGASGTPAVVQNSEFQTTPTPYGNIVFANLPGQSGVVQPLVEGQEYSITDGNSSAFDATQAGGGSGKYLVRYNGMNWEAHWMTVRFDTAELIKPDIGAYAGSDTRVGRVTADRLTDVVNVKDFGALGDGSTDDTTAITDAIDYAYTLGNVLNNHTGAIVYFPPGTYVIGSPPLYLDRDYSGFISYVGAGRGVSILTGSVGNSLPIEEFDAAFVVKAGESLVTGGQMQCLQDLSIFNTSTTVHSGAIRIAASGTNLRIERCHFHGYIGLAHSSNVFAATMKDCLFTCSVDYSAASDATRTPFYDIAKFEDVVTVNVQNDAAGVVKINGTTARVITTAHSFAVGSRVTLSRFFPVDWTPNAFGSDIVTVLAATSTTFDYTLTATPAAFTNPDIFPSVSQSKAYGSVGAYTDATGIMNCRFEGFDLGLAYADNSTIVIGCKFYRCGAGILVGLRGGSPKGVSEGSFVRPLNTEYRGSSSSHLSSNWFDRCSIGIHHRSGNSSKFAAHRFTGYDGPWPAATISGISPSGTTATVTCSVSHNLPVGDTKLRLIINPTTFTPNDEAVVVTRTGASTFTYPLTGTPTFVSGTWNYTPDYGFASNHTSATTHFCYSIECPTNYYGFACWYPGIHDTTVNTTSAWCMRGTTWGQPESAGLATCGWQFTQCGNATSYPIWCSFADRPEVSGSPYQPGAFQGQTFTFVDCTVQSAFAGTVTGSGSNHYKVRYDGTNWIRVG